MPQRLKAARNRVVGTKQAMKALEQGKALVVFLARDAEAHISKPVADLCRQNNVELVFVDSMQELGQSCGIQVGAASAAILRD